MIWQGNLHVARHQSQRGDQNSSAQVDIEADTKLLHCNESPQSNCLAKSPPGLVQIAVSTLLPTVGQPHISAPEALSIRH